MSATFETLGSCAFIQRTNFFEQLFVVIVVSLRVVQILRMEYRECGMQRTQNLVKLHHKNYRLRDT